MSRQSYQIKPFTFQTRECFLTLHIKTFIHLHLQTQSALPCLQEEWLHVSFLLTPASEVAGRVVGCRSKVTGQDVAVTPFPLLMCPSVTLATTPREVVLLRHEEGRREKREKVDQCLSSYKRKCQWKISSR